MNRDFNEINTTLTEQIFEQARIQFQSVENNISLQPLPLATLPCLLERLKISIPESMMKDYLKCMQTLKAPKMTFKQFTHYVARASLEQQVEEQLRNLFYFIDKEETGTVNAQDLCVFVRDLEGGGVFSEKQIDSLMKELDQKQMGFVSYEDFIYGLLPK